MALDAAPRTALRLELASGPCAIPLHLAHHLTGLATLSGEPDDCFLGWLTLHGSLVPVFDLNRVVCDEPTPERFGTRILIVQGGKGSPTPLVGLVAGGMTDTISPSDPGFSDIETLDLDSYLPMLYALVPPVPA
jgi:hypothetical protein